MIHRSVSDCDVSGQSDPLEYFVRKDDYIALAAFRRVVRRYIRFVEEGAISAGLTPQQHQVLLAIRGQAEREWASVGEIADFLQLKHHATVGLVNRCQAAGLVERSPDTRDRRIVRVSLTPKGAEIMDRLTHRNLKELKALGAIQGWAFETLDSS